MRVRVLVGTVRADDREYKVGEELNLPEGEAKSIIEAGAVEEVKEEKKPKVKPKTKPKEKPEPKPEPKAEVEAEPEPSMDWTRKELNVYAKAHGIEEPEQFDSKGELLEAIKGGEEK